MLKWASSLIGLQNALRECVLPAAGDSIYRSTFDAPIGAVLLRRGVRAMAAHHETIVAVHQQPRRGHAPPPFVAAAEAQTVFNT
jgi:hypothetical protein